MNQLLVALSLVGQVVVAQHTEPVQFDHSAIGRNVTVCIDGTVEKAFAGKLSFHDQTHSWMSVCADVRSPISASQIFTITVRNTLKTTGPIHWAGNIVAKYFRSAQTPQQCAGLQIAVWKVMEDGDNGTDFSSGHFQASADKETMFYAQQYIQAADDEGNALFLQVQGGGGSGGSGGGGGAQGGGGSGQNQLSG